LKKERNHTKNLRTARETQFTTYRDFKDDISDNMIKLIDIDGEGMFFFN